MTAKQLSDKIESYSNHDLNAMIGVLAKINEMEKDLKEAESLLVRFMSTSDRFRLATLRDDVSKFLNRSK